MTWENKWPVVTAVTGFVALFMPFLVPLLMPILGLDTKGLAVDRVSTAVLVDLSDPVLSSLELTYKGASVSRLTVATFEVRNSGTRPIEQADFNLPLVIRFKNPSDVLAVTLGQRTPQDLKPSISSDDRGITIDPLLLNSGDTFRITVQLRGDFHEPTVTARISGVPSISQQIYHRSGDTWSGSMLLAMGGVSTMLYFYFVVLIFPPVRRGRPFTLVPLPESLVVVAALLLAGNGLLITGTRLLALEPSDVKVFFGYAVFGLLCASIMIPLAYRRASQLRPLLNP